MSTLSPQRIALAVVAVVALAPVLAAAQPPCDEPDYQDGWHHTDNYAGLVYVAWDCFDDGHGYCSWNYPVAFYLYLETNGVPDLQRGGNLLLMRDRCQSSESPDQMIFG